jgi:hypothetical protein
MARPQTVITYRLAFLPHKTVDLCRRHARRGMTIGGYTLGTVTTPAHAGTCATCATIPRRPKRPKKPTTQQTIRAIVQILDGEPWTPATLDAIAAALRAGGFDARDVAED